MAFKKGRFTLDEMDQIRSLREHGYTVNEVAERLNRDPISVDAWIEKNIGKNPEQREEIELANELRSTPYYRELQRQFDSDDVELFEMHWKELWHQFKNDVFHTEVMQIMDLCKLEVLMNQKRRSVRVNDLRVDQVYEELQQERGTQASTPEQIQERRETIALLNRQIDSIKAGNSSLESDYKDYQKQKNDILKAIKGTRDQRIKEVESSKDTWQGMLKRILTDPKYRDEFAKQWEKVRIASEKKKVDMAKPIEYEDGNVDSPILRPEDFDNVLDDEKGLYDTKEEDDE